MWKASWDLSHWEACDNLNTSKITYGDIKEAFLAKEWNSFHFLGKKLGLPPPQGFSQIRMSIVLEATIDTTTTKDHCCLMHLEP